MMTTTQRIIPILVYADVAAAHNFLVYAFGFSPGGLHRDNGGHVIHAEVSLDGEAIWLHRVVEDQGLRSAAELRSATGMLNVFVDDVDAHHVRTVSAGATVLYPPIDQPYGQREYTATDPEGRATGPSPPVADRCRAGRRRTANNTLPVKGRFVGAPAS